MSVAVSVAQLLLACAFALAGIAKLLDRTGTQRAIRAFGAPRRLVGVGAVALPVAELAIAAALIPAATARWAAIAALALLLIFSVAIARVLLSGATPDCNCFGGLTQTEVGRGTLIRNLLLGGVAVFAAFGAGDQSIGALNWIVHPGSGERVAVIVLASAVVILGWFCWQLLRQNGRLLLQLDAQSGGPPAANGGPPTLEAGDIAPGFAGHDLDSEPISLSSLLGGRLPVALFFTDPACGACASVLELVARTQRERSRELTMAVISRGDVDRMRERSEQLGLERVVPQNGDALFESYRVHGVPGALLIDPDGRILRPPVLGASATREMIESATGERLRVHVGVGA